MILVPLVTQVLLVLLEKTGWMAQRVTLVLWVTQEIQDPQAQMGRQVLRVLPARMEPPEKWAPQVTRV